VLWKCLYVKAYNLSELTILIFMWALGVSRRWIPRLRHSRMWQIRTGVSKEIYLFSNRNCRGLFWSSICLELRGKGTTYLSQDSLSLGTNLSLGPPNYEMEYAVSISMGHKSADKGCRFLRNASIYQPDCTVRYRDYNLNIYHSDYLIAKIAKSLKSMRYIQEYCGK
jgi:hypothetical protein